MQLIHDFKLDVKVKIIKTRTEYNITIIIEVLKMMEKRDIHPLFLLLLVVLMALIPVLSEALFGGPTPRTLWYIRIIDLVDILFMTPIYIITYLYIYDRLSKGEKPGRYVNCLFVVMLSFFIGGHFMHFATNAINTYAYEVKHYVIGKDIPRDVAALAYLLDEVVSHIIMFTTMYLMFSFFILLDHEQGPTQPSNKRDSIVLTVAGVIFGTMLGIGAIEAQMIYYILVLDILLTIYIVVLTLKIKKTIEHLTDLINYRFTFFIVVSCLWLPLIALTYYLIFGSFIQPSEMFREGTSIIKILLRVKK